MVPQELTTDQNDNTDQLISNLANKITLTDKELNAVDETPGSEILIATKEEDADKPADAEFV